MIERYTLPEIGAVWSEEAKYRAWLKVELAVSRARASLGEIPPEEVEALAEKADFSVKRIHEIEAETNHDVIAFVTAISERVDDLSARHLHFGLTSSDVVDTAGALQLRDSLALIQGEARELTLLLTEMALVYRQTVMIGRTHGVHAEPTTLGHKLAVWAFEMERNLERLSHAEEVASVGKVSGAVGTYANVDPKVEALACEKLGLRPALASTQIVQRDRHAEVLSALAIVGSTIEKIALEVRSAQRTEVRELAEPFGREQKGSSAMPHKRNPILAERLCGMARLLRGYAGVGLENNALWQERDISHSSAERVVLPDSTTVAFYMLRTAGRVLKGIQVDEDRMRKNLNLGGGIVYSGRILLALVEAGMGRDEAYAVVQRAAMRAWGGEGGFRDLLGREEEVRKRLGPDLDTLFDPAYFVRNLKVVFERVEDLRRRLGLSESLLYEGKAKKVFSADEEGVLLQRYKDDATAFDGKKRGTIGGKGRTNATMSAAIFRYLETRGVLTHFVDQVDDETIKIKKLEMLPVEVVIRNVAAGSLARRIGYEEGTPLKAPIVELYLKSDELGDPLLNRHHFRELGVADEDLDRCEEIGHEVNEILRPFFDERGVTLVDFKVEVGRDKEGDLLLADEVSPDTCRLWDKETGEKLDKDRFRRDMGGVEEAYEEMLRRVTEMGSKETMD